MLVEPPGHSSRRLVVAAVIAREDGRLLMARRPPQAHLAGLWEFPGGTVEEGEDAETALRRELEEELGVAAEVGEPFTFAWHRGGERDVLLLFYRARITAGKPDGREGQEVAWVTLAELSRLATPPADAALIAKLTEGLRLEA
jgi:8-oxo-dGTP diphosphatase